MKLTTKTNLNFLSGALFTFLFGIIAFYFTLRYEVDKYINTELNKAKTTFLTQNDSLPVLPFNTFGSCHLYSVKELNTAVEDYSFFTDTLLFDAESQRYLPYREMTFSSRFQNQTYEIRIFRSLEETDSLIIHVFLIMTLLVIILIVTLLTINFYSSKQIWKDFYTSLDKINNFDLDVHQSLKLANTDVQEFADLNTVLTRMSNRIANDYFRMKEYTENASHEIQTPLAIINTKLELLLQSKDIPKKQYQTIAEAYDASNRLARLNKTLILLTRIENRQFPELEMISPKEIIERQLENYEDIIASKNLQLNFVSEPDVQLQINPYLSEILFLNLIKNAIRHNIPGGQLNLKLTHTAFEISNSGNPLNISADKLFHRFYKKTKSDKSLGLGLAIVKKITEIFHYTIQYSYQNNQHHFLVRFR